jgi:CubicO group peptidase (beta-lactamase class C family)
MTHLIKIQSLIICLMCSQLANAAPDEQAMGKDQNYPVGNIRSWTQPQFRIGSWSAPHKIEGLANTKIEKSLTPVSITKASTPVDIKYAHNLSDYSVDQYFERQKVTSLQILKDGKLLVEKYQYGRGTESRFLSYSMAKSITGLLVGVALDKGLIKSLDDPAETYSPTLKGTSYGSTSVKELMRMASGIEFVENYTGNDDVAKLSRSVITGAPPTTELFKSYSRKFQPGQKFNYSSLETMALGYLLKDVSGKTISQLTKEWLWDPLGAEDEAYWLLSKDGMEGVYCCFAASPRDWAKIGLLFASAGTMNGQPIVSSRFISEAASSDDLPSSLKTGINNSYAGYGYQVWLLPGKGRQFYLRGIHGQSIFVQAESGLVMVHTAAFEMPSARMSPAPYDEMLNLWRGVVKSVGIND